MKFRYITLTFLGLGLLLNSGCSEDMLLEEPKSILSPDYFRTPEGLNAGVVSAYAYNRYFYGGEPLMNLTVFGTDEFTNGRDGGAKPINNYEADLNPGNGQFSGPWGWSYTAINTCNGIIQLGPEADMAQDQKTQLIAEAKFLRAHYYFILLRLFGGATLNLGSGDLAFNTSPTTEYERATLDETYAAIISDLEDAIEELPPVPSQPGRASAALAHHVLAKVYLRRGQEDDPDVAEADDLDKAIAHADMLIENQGNFGLALLDDYGDVFAEGNEYNSEVLWTVERNADNQYNDLGTELRENRSSYFFRPLYESVDGLQRDLAYGRPWVRFRPTGYLVDVAFSHKDKDSRYSESFQTVWLANDDAGIPNWTQAEADAGCVDPSMVGEPKFGIGDTALWIPPHYVDPECKPYRVVNPQDYIPRTPDFTEIEPALWPSLRKYDDTQRPAIPDASIRPFIVYKFSETYLIAAEAIVQGGSGNANPPSWYINQIRTRAAFPGFENDPDIVVNDADVDINFILDERTRELAGEAMRWFDLVRTDRLIERVNEEAQITFGPPSSPTTEVVPYNPPAQNNIREHHKLRPIPQNQIDLTSNVYPQNPGY